MKAPSPFRELLFETRHDLVANMIQRHRSSAMAGIYPDLRDYDRVLGGTDI
jgi:hypothetical protein